MLTNTYTVTKLHTSTTTQGVDALIEQLEQDYKEGLKEATKRSISNSKLRKNSVLYRLNHYFFSKHYTQWRNAEKYLNILKEGTNNAK